MWLSRGEEVLRALQQLQPRQLYQLLLDLVVAVGTLGHLLLLVLVRGLRLLQWGAVVVAVLVLTPPLIRVLVAMVVVVKSEYGEMHNERAHY